MLPSLTSRIMCSKLCIHVFLALLSWESPRKGLKRSVRRCCLAAVAKRVEALEVGKRVEALWEEDLNWYAAIVEEDPLFSSGGVSKKNFRSPCTRNTGIYLGRLWHYVWKEFPNGTVKIRWDDPDGWPDVSICDLEDVRTLRLSYKPGRENSLWTRMKLFAVVNFIWVAKCFFASGDLVVALFEDDYEWYNATVVQDLQVWLSKNRKYNGCRLIRISNPASLAGPRQ